MLEKFKTAYGYVLDALFPKKCVSCGDITEYGEDICINCRKQLIFIDLEKRCPACGKEKYRCECKKSVYRFRETVSPLEYSGVARKAILRYKINCKPYYADFFAEFMAKSIVEVYGDIAFDVICYVPSGIKTELGRGFNPAKLFADKLSKFLMIPIADALFIAQKRRSQHKSKSRQVRFENAYGKYACNTDLTGKTVLLIDDIMTTGATLDDCTRALMFAGAESVYCSTALITAEDKPKKT